MLASFEVVCFNRTYVYVYSTVYINPKLANQSTDLTLTSDINMYPVQFLQVGLRVVVISVSRVEIVLLLLKGSQRMSSVSNDTFGRWYKMPLMIR